MLRFFWILITRLILTFAVIGLIAGGIGYALYLILT